MMEIENTMLNYNFRSCSSNVSNNYLQIYGAYNDEYTINDPLKLLLNFPGNLESYAHMLPYIEDRKPLVNALNSVSTSKDYCLLFSATCGWYNRVIPKCPDGSRYIHEYANILKKRPFRLSETLLNENPNNTELWILRARLWKGRPNIAANVLETALKTINPKLTCGTQMYELYSEYADLLFQNSTEKRFVCQMIHEGIDDLRINEDSRTELILLLVSFKETVDSVSALNILNSYLSTEKYSCNQKLWVRYIELAIQTESDNVLQIFNRSCIVGTVTVRIVLNVAAYFANDYISQDLVFERGITLFRMPLSNRIWGEYLVSLLERNDQDKFNKIAVNAITEARQTSLMTYESFAILFAELFPHMVLKVRQITHDLIDLNSQNEEVHLKYMSTFGTQIEHGVAQT